MKNQILGEMERILRTGLGNQRRRSSKTIGRSSMRSTLELHEEYMPYYPSGRYITYRHQNRLGPQGRSHWSHQKKSSTVLEVEKTSHHQDQRGKTMMGGDESSRKPGQIQY